MMSTHDAEGGAFQYWVSYDQLDTDEVESVSLGRRRIGPTLAPLKTEMHPQVSAYGPRVRVVTGSKKCGKILFVYQVHAT